MASITKQDLESLWGRSGRNWLTEKIRESGEVIKQTLIVDEKNLVYEALKTALCVCVF